MNEHPSPQQSQQQEQSFGQKTNAIAGRKAHVHIRSTDLSSRIPHSAWASCYSQFVLARLIIHSVDLLVTRYHKHGLNRTEPKLDGAGYVEGVGVGTDPYYGRGA